MLLPNIDSIILLGIVEIQQHDHMLIITKSWMCFRLFNYVVVAATATATLLATTLVINDDEPSLVLLNSFIFIPKSLCLFFVPKFFFLTPMMMMMMLPSSSSQNHCVFFCSQIFFLTPMLDDDDDVVSNLQITNLVSFFVPRICSTSLITHLGIFPSNFPPRIFFSSSSSFSFSSLSSIKIIK